MPPCHGGDRGFESPRGRQFLKSPNGTCFRATDFPNSSFNDIDKVLLPRIRKCLRELFSILSYPATFAHKEDKRRAISILRELSEIDKVKII